MDKELYKVWVAETDTRVFCPVCKCGLFTFLDDVDTGHSNGLCCAVCKYKLMFDSMDLRSLYTERSTERSVDDLDYGLPSDGSILQRD